MSEKFKKPSHTLKAERLADPVFESHRVVTDILYLVN
jgi:hypothetical protein